MNKALLLIFFTFILCNTNAQRAYKKLFFDKTLCLYYDICGDSISCEVTQEKWHIFDGWAGPTRRINHRIEDSNIEIVMRDSASRRVIYNSCYSSLFSEWQVVRKGVLRGVAFKESARMPQPKHSVEVSLVRHFVSGIIDTILTTTYNPKYHNAVCSKREYPILQISRNGSSHKNIDLVFLPEGYKADEMYKFEASVEEFTHLLFEYEPFAKYRNRFNISAILSPSPESGVDIPLQGINSNTLMDFTFGMFNVDRYVGTFNYQSVCDIASNVSWDYVIIVANTSKYGGGGIYNFYSVFSGNNECSIELLVHEFGHGFANLADEYSEPNNPLTAKVEPNRSCIMHDLQTHYFCNFCSDSVERIIRFFLNKK